MNDDTAHVDRVEPLVSVDHDLHEVIIIAPSTRPEQKGIEIRCPSGDGQAGAELGADQLGPVIPGRAVAGRRGGVQQAEAMVLLEVVGVLLEQRQPFVQVILGYRPRHHDFAIAG